MVPLPFHVVDVFGRVPLAGNPLAVIGDADDLSDAEMASIARFTNLSETTFLCAPRDPAADYRLRIFTPSGELPFAGHPTLGSARVWLDLGGVPRRPGVLTQECGIGLVTVTVDAHTIGFEAPPLLHAGTVDDDLAVTIAATLGVDRSSIIALAHLDNGPGWIGVQLESADAVITLSRPTTPLALGVVGLCDPNAESRYEVRAFFPEHDQTIEDPVTGSLHAALATWMIDRGMVAAPFTATQGRCVGRDGIVSIAAPRGTVVVRGAVHRVVVGSINP
jgi:PhzF family phenazine biosynthesis protein